MTRRFSRTQARRSGGFSAFREGNEPAHVAGRRPEHVPNGFPHHSKANGLCMCLSSCCLGPAGCRCKSCPCAGEHAPQQKTRTRKLKSAICFACGDPATTTCEGEAACADCKAEFYVSV